MIRRCDAPTLDLAPAGAFRRNFFRAAAAFGCAGGLAFCARLDGADVTLRWEMANAVAPLALDAAPQRVGANTLTLTRVAALVSGVAFVRADGSFAQLEAQFGALDLGAGRAGFTLRGVPEGRYIGLQFFVGVRPDANHSDPGRWDARHPLNPLVNGLHWSWQGGYVFLALEGRYARAAEAEPAGWSFHLATDPRLMLVEVPHALEIRGDTELTLALDLARVLEGVTLTSEGGGDSTHSAEGDALAVRLAANVSLAFRVARVAPAMTKADASAVASTQPATPVRGTPLAFNVPTNWPQPALPADNPLTAEGVALGEALFFDRRLSSNGAQSCASCHAPANAFSDTVAFSRGAEPGTVGVRNAMPLVNLAWAANFAWDGSQPRVRDQALAAMTNPIEMNAEPAKIVAQLARDAALGTAFAAAFGDSAITAERIGLALEQYLLTRQSADSRFDRALHGRATLTEEEKEGFALFMTEYDPPRGKRGADCFHCHGGPLFSDFAFKHNGLDFVSADAGRAKVTGRAADRGKFKTPSLRDVALTAPYMHDGRFATLEQVVAHYDHGIRRSAELDPNIAKHPARGMRLTPEEQRALVAFLKSLTTSRADDVARATRLGYSSPSQ